MAISYGNKTFKIWSGKFKTGPKGKKKTAGRTIALIVKNKRGYVKASEFEEEITEVIAKFLKKKYRASEDE